MRLANKVIVITGSTRGIGRAIAEACARAGGKVVICSRDKHSVDKTIKSIRAKGYRVTGTIIDVSQGEDLKKLMEFALQKYGTIDVWINNAGLSGGYRMLFDIPEDEMREIIEVNQVAILRACKLIIPYFLKQRKGIIINLGGRGSRGEAAQYMATYASTKAAVTSLTKSLAKEYETEPISIHCLLPGMVKTDFYKDVKVSPNLTDQIDNLPYILDSFGVPVKEVANAAVAIAAQEPGKSTGKVYSLMGGARMMKAIFAMMRLRLAGKLK
jgi:short-subunit dehydrogenase